MRGPSPWRRVADQLRPKLPKLAAFLDEAEADVLAYMTFPAQHRAKASDTVMASHKDFNGLEFTGTGPKTWSVQFDDKKTYRGDENKLKGDQLVKGGARLAELLNAIWP